MDPSASPLSHQEVCHYFSNSPSYNRLSRIVAENGVAQEWNALSHSPKTQFLYLKYMEFLDTLMTFEKKYNSMTSRHLLPLRKRGGQRGRGHSMNTQQRGPTKSQKKVFLMLEQFHSNFVDTLENCLKKTSHSKRHSKRQLLVLKRWFDEHQKDPYPTPEEKGELQKVTGLTQKQIDYWFSNKRNRVKTTKQQPRSPSIQFDNSSPAQSSSSSEFKKEELPQSPQHAPLSFPLQSPISNLQTPIPQNTRQSPENSRSLQPLPGLSSTTFSPFPQEDGPETENQNSFFEVFLNPGISNIAFDSPTNENQGEEPREDSFGLQQDLPSPASQNSNSLQDEESSFFSTDLHTHETTPQQPDLTDNKSETGENYLIQLMEVTFMEMEDTLETEYFHQFGEEGFSFEKTVENWMLENEVGQQPQEEQPGDMAFGWWESERGEEEEKMT